MTIVLAGETLELLAERALWWPRFGLLALSDLHLGKAESLQREGVPVPAEAGASDLARLGKLIDELRPQEVLILGDFIHQRTSWTASLKSALHSFFMSHRNLDWGLILGNHERGSEAELRDFPLAITTDDVKRESLIFTHGHRPQASGFYVAGHAHPVITLRDGPLRMRFPCFELRRSGLVLPSFGTWTGGQESVRQRGVRRFAVTPSEVFEVSER